VRGCGGDKAAFVTVFARKYPYAGCLFSLQILNGYVTVNCTYDGLYFMHGKWPISSVITGLNDSINGSKSRIQGVCQTTQLIRKLVRNIRVLCKRKIFNNKYISNYI
jgi:hypothetical protein